jgi:uncharacterized protein (TIGR03382 family)
VNRILLPCFLVLTASPALAFHEVDSFGRSANSGGGASSYYTGSPRFRSYDCNICHLDAEQRISIELGGNLVSGSYEAGLIYRIDVRLVGEHRGLESAFNPNTFTADITDLSGNPVGELSSSFGSIVEIVDEGRVAVAEGFGNGETEWSFSWFAPDAAVPARLHIAMLDGDGASDPVRRFIDPLNDDVATATLDLCPAGMQCEAPPAPDEETSPAGCSAGGPGTLGVGAVVVLLLLGFRRRPVSSVSCAKVSSMRVPDQSEWTHVGTTTNSHFYVIEPGILAAEAMTGATDTAETAQENLDFYLEHFRQAGPGVLIYILGRVVDQKPAARRVYNRKSNRELVRGVALVFRSRLAQAMVAFFMGMTQSKETPVKAMHSVDDAVEWARARLKEVGLR